MATKAPAVGYLPGNEPEAVFANQEYAEALKKLGEALDARQNRFIDPQALALAQGFLAPTQTGGFGESLGYAAKNLREAMTEEEKQDMAIAEAKLGLAGRGLEMEKLRQRDRELMSMLGIEPTTVGMKGQAPLTAAGQTRGALPGRNEPPPGFAGVVGIQQLPPSTTKMTGRDYIMASRYDTSKPLPDVIEKASEIEKRRYEVRESGVQDLVTGMFYPFPKGEQVVRQIYGFPGEYKVSSKDAMLLDMYASQGSLDKYEELAKRIVEGPKAPEKPAAKEGEPPKAEAKKEPVKTGLATTTELEAERAGATETAQQRAKARETERNEVIAAGKDWATRNATYSSLEKVANDPMAKFYLGVFENGKFTGALGKVIEGGVNVAGFTIGLPQIREMMALAGLKEDEIQRYQMGIYHMANAQLQMSKMVSGQGAVSNFERDLFGSASFSTKDTPQTIKAKVALLKARNDFDRERAKAVRRYKGNIDDFMDSDEYANMEQNYVNRLSGIMESTLGVKTKPPKITSGSSKGRDNKGAADRLEKEGL